MGCSLAWEDTEACFYRRYRSNINGIARLFWNRHAEKLVCRGTLGRRKPTLKRLPLRCSGKNSRGRSGQEPDVKHRFVMNEISISTEDLPPMMNCHCTNQHIDWRSRDS